MTPRNLATCLAPTLFFPSVKLGGMESAIHHIGHALNLVDVSLELRKYASERVFGSSGLRCWQND